MSPERLNWRLHWGVLATLVAAYVAWSWHAWFPPPGEWLHLDRLASFGFLVGGLAYGLVTTLIMIWVARFHMAPILLHLVPLATFGLYAEKAFRQQSAWEKAADESHREVLRREGEQAELGTCLHVERLDAEISDDLVTKLTFFNACPFRVVISGVDVSASKGADSWIAFPITPRIGELTELGPTERKVFLQTDSSNRGNLRLPGKWVWEVSVLVDQPASPKAIWYGTEITAQRHAIDQVTIELKPPTDP